MARRVWGYMAMTKIPGEHDSFWYKRYTPMETVIDGRKIWYKPEDPNDPTAGFSITDAASGFGICTAKCTRVSEIPEKIHKYLELMKTKTADSHLEYRERCEWVADLMKFVSQFEGPNKGNLITPPEEIDYGTVFETWTVKNVHNIDQIE